MTSTSDKILKYLYEHPDIPVALDTETDGLQVHDGRSKAIGLSIAFRHENGKLYSYYWGARHRAGREQNIDKATAQKIRYVLEKQRRVLIFANVQFDVLAMLTLGVDLRENPFLDVLTMMMFVNEEWTQGRRGLDELAVYWECERKLSDWPHTQFKDTKAGPRPIPETTLKWQKEHGWPDTTPEMIFDYASVDAEVTYAVAEKILADREWKTLPPHLWVEKQEFIRTLIEMRLRGVEMDLELTAELLEEGEAAKEKVIETLGLNPASHKDLVELFINRLELPVFKRSEKTGAPSFDKTVMPLYDEILARDDRTESKYVRVFRGWQTAVGLLLKPYLELTSPDNRLRTSYTTHVVATGRLSSREPNLQQISKDGGSPWNDRVKKCFVARPGFVLLSADYSQLELRLATAYAQESKLLEIFEEGRDVFTEMTETLQAQFRASGSTALAEAWTRHKTKTLVYSIQYGGGVNRIMNAFGISKRDAEKVISNFYRTYPRFRRLDEMCKAKVKETKRIKLWSGRYRHFRYESENYKAMNSLMQGGAADVVERVMVYAMKHLDNPDCRMLLQVHDALVFEVRDDLAEEYAVKIQTLMEDVNGICDPTGTEPLFPVRFAVEVSEW